MSFETRCTEQELRNNFAKATVFSNVVTWNSNGNVPFDDMLNDFRTLGLVSNVTLQVSKKAREKQVAAQLQAYRVAQAQRSPEEKAEEMFEMRAAFGEGEEVVNVVTGEVTRL